MKDSKNGKNARMGVPEDAELTAFEHKERRLTAATHGLGRKSLSHEKRREILNQLFFEGEARQHYVRQFYTLLTLAAIIATFGLIRDSTAVVIGAMLVSPLMTPILGVAASLVMGWPVRAGRVAIRLFFATSFVFGLAYLTCFVLRYPTNVTFPPEILARTNRNLLPMLRNQLADLGDDERDPWRRSIAEEIEAMESDRYRLPWRDGFPEPLERSLEPYRGRLDESYSPLCNPLEAGLQQH